MVIETGPDPTQKAQLQRSGSGLAQTPPRSGLSVSRQTVIAIENGKYDPSLPLAFKLAAVFGASIEDLFTPAAEE